MTSRKPMKSGFKHASSLEEYLSMRREIKDNGCWYWTGGCDPDGYGRHTNKWYKLHGKSGIHQLSYICYVGPIGDKHVCHRCDNPTCFNPEHLFLGDNQINMTDKVLKRRQPAKLTPELVNEIRQRYASENITQKLLAVDYGMSEEAIRRAIKFLAWKEF